MRLDRKIGVSYRQLDWWTRKGYINEMPEKPGSGYARRYTPEEEAVAILMGQLVACGFKPSAAAELARLAIDSDADLIELGNDILLALGPLSAGGNLGSNRDHQRDIKRTALTQLSDPSPLMSNGFTVRISPGHFLQISAARRSNPRYPNPPFHLEVR
jgi:hypothetical protein